MRSGDGSRSDVDRIGAADFNAPRRFSLEDPPPGAGHRCDVDRIGAADFNAPRRFSLEEPRARRWVPLRGSPFIADVLRRFAFRPWRTKRVLQWSWKFAALSFCERQSSYVRGVHEYGALKRLPRQDGDCFLRSRIPDRTRSVPRARSRRFPTSTNCKSRGRIGSRYGPSNQFLRPIVMQRVELFTRTTSKETGGFYK